VTEQLESGVQQVGIETIAGRTKDRFRSKSRKKAKEHRTG
jgi:hypothetical protein